MNAPHRTTCSRDCPDACSMLVTVEDGRAVRLRGDPADPVTRGFLCERTARFLERQDRDDRILSPLLRRAGALVPVGWDEALDHVARGLRRIRQESGGAAILHYKSGGSLGLVKHYADLLFERFGPVTVKRGDICSGAGEAAQELDFGVCDSHDLFDLQHSKVILLWGKNPHVSGPHLLPLLLEARRRGTVLIGFDPVRTRAASLCDHFLQPRPGSDFQLAMAFSRWLLDHDALDPEASSYCDHLEDYLALVRGRSFEEWLRPTDLAARDVEPLAELYGTRGPAAILVGWGMARRRHGAATVRALDALGAVSGNLGIAGGGVSFYFSRRAAYDFDFLEHSAPRTVSETRLGQELLETADPPIRAAWITTGNPVSMLPDSESVRRGLQRCELVVCVETHPTDTTDLATVVLPTLTLLEDDDVLGAYGNHYLRASTPAVAPPEGPRHEYSILLDLAARLGVREAMPADLTAAKRRLMRRLHEAGVTLEDLQGGAVRSPFAPSVLFADRRFATATGKVQLLREAPPDPATAGVDGYPLQLLAISHPLAQSSQWHGALREAALTVSVHPDAAGGLGEGDRALLESRHGTLAVVVHLDPRLRPEVAMVPKGGMLRDGRCANRLIAAVETDAGGGAAYYDEPVRLVKDGP